MALVKDSEDLRWYFGCFYATGLERGTLTVTQKMYAEELAAKFGGGADVAMLVSMKLGDFD